MSIIVYYVNDKIRKEIDNNKNDYLFFEISENSEKALEDKCKIILSNQALDWQPLFLEYKDFVHMYVKKFYYKK